MIDSSNIFKALFAVSVFSLAACSGGGGGGSGGGASTSGPTAGTYATGCVHPDVNDSYTYNITVSSGSVSFLTVQYEETSACTTAAVETAATHYASYPGAASTPSGAQKIDMTVGTVTMTPKSSAAVTLLNSNSRCGYNNWALNVAKNITTNSSCGWGANTKAFSIYKMDSSTLYLGKGDGSHNGLSESQRHVQLETLSYIKQ